jgi:hypothetical protein
LCPDLEAIAHAHNPCGTGPTFASTFYHLFFLVDVPATFAFPYPFLVSSVSSVEPPNHSRHHNTLSDLDIEQGIWTASIPWNVTLEKRGGQGGNIKKFPREGVVQQQQS